MTCARYLPTIAMKVRGTDMPLIDIQPEGWKAPKGYANGMMGTGRLLLVGGQIGWTADQRFLTSLEMGRCFQ